MTEASGDSESSLPVWLELRASESVQELVGDLLKEKYQSALAQSAFLTLMLRPDKPVTLPIVEDSKTKQLTPQARALKHDYIHSVENIKSKDPIFLRHLPLAPEFRYGRNKTRRLTGFLFTLQLNDADKDRLLLPPFDGVDRQRLAVGHVFHDDVLKTGEEFDEAVQFVRKKLTTGLYIDPKTHKVRAADRYYVTRPTLKP